MAEVGSRVEGLVQCGYASLCVHIHQNKSFDDFGLLSLWDNGLLKN